MSKIKSERNKNVMILSRTFDAPIDMVFDVHSDCKHLMNWYGGNEWPLVKCEMDFQEGGRWNYCFKLPEGQTCGIAIFKEIKRPEMIVYKEHFLDENGEISKEYPAGLMTLEFIKANGKITIVNRWEYPTTEDLDLMLEMGAIEGLTEVWDRLFNYLNQL